MEELFATKEIEVRFSEVDSMGIVWHGSYAKYFEDAREEFGRKYDIGYLKIFAEGFYAPLVKLDFNYKRPLTYGDKLLIKIIYRPTPAAKICFDYEVYSVKDSSQLMTAGSSLQVFMDKKYELVWSNPDFYEAWKRKWNVI